MDPGIEDGADIFPVPRGMGVKEYLQADDGPGLGTEIKVVVDAVGEVLEVFCLGFEGGEVAGPADVTEPIAQGGSSGG